MLETQWCCVPLRSAVLIIGILDMLVDGLQLIMVGYGAVEKSVRQAQGAGSDDPWIIATMVGQVMVCTVDFLMAAVLLRGVHKETMKMVMAWWWWTFMQVTVHSILAIVFLVKSNYVSGLMLVVIFFIFALSFYSLVVVRLYVLSLKRKKKLANEILLQERQEMMDI